MKREPIYTFTATEHPQLTEFAKAIHSGRYFDKLDLGLVKNMLRQGELVSLKKDEYVLKEGDTSLAEMYILIEGSLAVMSQGKFILRLEFPGDVVGEMGVIHPAPRSADVIAETDSHLIAFSADMFTIDKSAQHAPIFYVMFCHVLAAKLRITTAQSMIRKNERVSAGKQAKVGILDEDGMDRMMIRGIVENNWTEAIPIEIEDIQKFIENPLEHRFDLIVGDISTVGSDKVQHETTTKIIEAMKMHGAPIFIISEACNDATYRELLMKLGIDEVMAKPYSVFEVKHSISKYRVWYYKHCELDKAEHDAETDRLTGLANRRRLDEFMEALITLYPENNQPFSLIISDVDNFKHYNDTQGHQMGDVVLARVAGIFAKNVRRGDLAARFGGEEFVMLLPNCPMKPAIEVAEKLRHAVEAEEFPHQDQQPTGNLTATFGVATYDGEGDLAELLKKADDCLYRGKEAGRNIVIAAE
ncbi:MAG: diguanylate cyclase [SAR324 cluster bacterium]|nr:diguanylate cyclase [SAR324 cluster bacterium]